jgi:DNA-binding LytR/AlgR family response regulator
MTASMEVLRQFCEKTGKITVKAACRTAEQALDFLSRNSVDLIFLDVEMPGLNGFELLDRLVGRPQVIVTTAEEAHAYRAFEYRVTDFLRKPFSYQRFVDAVEKAELTRQFMRSSDEQVFIKSNGKVVRLPLRDILFVESMGDYVRYVTAEKKYITLSTMKEVENLLPAQHFMKVHRSYIVQLSKAVPARESHLAIGAYQVPVSKANRQAVGQRLKSD